MSTEIPRSAQPLENLEQWDDFLEGRYRKGKSESEFRQYDAGANPGVAEFYRLNHENQTVEYVLRKEKEYFGLSRRRQTIWEAAEFLNTLVDDSDPDTDLTQIEHLLLVVVRACPEDELPPRVEQAGVEATVCVDQVKLHLSAHFSFSASS